MKKQRHKKAKMLKKLKRGGADDAIPSILSGFDGVFDDESEFDHSDFKAGDPCPCCGKVLYEKVMTYQEMIEFERKNEAAPVS